MKIIILTILLLIPQISEAQSAWVQDITNGSYIISAFVDVSTTQYGLGKGIVHEANPVQKYFTDKGPVASGAAKGAMHVGIVYTMMKFQDKQPKIVLISGILLNGFQVWVDYSNMKVIQDGIKK